ncbi:MAG TPA: WXG100 family type VII secretion target [Candidatus Monoglobus merdigallinarum]|uniref:ESAT-6-like protein n=1 Tax=Candidatus Monoglobus merdigallinarum TaxID=2838698 RepID=A0A9D1TLH6_9FIRM|nr:WXG100 family type VII secretion target [Candidatus Monoglobus merdigallinarum]
MANQIKVSTEQLNSAATTLESDATNLSNIASQIAEISASLSSIWEGSAGQAYASKFASMQDDCQLLQKRVQEHCTDLQQMAQQYQSADDESAGLANSLPTDVVM